MQTLLNDIDLLGFGGVPQAVKNSCCDLLKETPTALFQNAKLIRLLKPLNPLFISNIKYFDDWG
jgi:hypothetical protein